MRWRWWRWRWRRRRGRRKVARSTVGAVGAKGALRGRAVQVGKRAGAAILARAVAPQVECARVVACYGWGWRRGWRRRRGRRRRRRREHVAAAAVSTVRAEITLRRGTKQLGERAWSAVLARAIQREFARVGAPHWRRRERRRQRGVAHRGLQLTPVAGGHRLHRIQPGNVAGLGAGERSAPCKESEGNMQPMVPR